MTTPSPREQFETRQRHWLLSCAVHESASGGRKHPETPHPYRTCFQRDRDRIIHCSAFRRLDYKTQVFVPHEHDLFRTRLTHTVEVAQVARDLARALRLNEDLAETVALAHDLGHAPFGHMGEKVLDELMADHGRFEHNRQSLRVVDYLEHPYPAFRGLNLTQVVRECLAKHESRYDSPICEDFDTSLRAPLEGQLVDCADAIAYTAADLEDALMNGWLTEAMLGEMEIWRQAWALAERDAPAARPIHKRIRATKAVLSILADNLIHTTQQALDGVRPLDVQAVRQQPAKIVAFSPPIDQAVSQLQELLLQRVYLHPLNLEKSRKGGKILREVFEALVRQPDLLPGRYRSRIDADGLHRTVCDYVAGMTDRYCHTEHARVCPQ